MIQETAILAGGCFWGMQDLVRSLPGVISTRVGYSGGDVPNATYRNHGTHAEAIEIVFDAETISFRRLLEFFFQIHDPTTPNRQGNDLGSSYRSGIYTTTDTQRAVALETIADVEASGLWPGKVVTELTRAGPFWEAEAEHQDYLLRHPAGYTCHFIRPDWHLPQRDKAAACSEHLFSYGTLQQEDVQIATFGRKLEGRPEQLPRYRLALLAIRDADVVATSGKTHHPIVSHTGMADDRVAGALLLLTPEELDYADRYEVSEYRRQKVVLESGISAWAYVDARDPAY